MLALVIRRRKGPTLAVAALNVFASLVALLGLGATQALALEEFRGRKRPVVVFSPTDVNPNFVRQRNAINGNRVGISDRDIVVLYVIGSSVKAEFGPTPRVGASALRSRFRVSDGQFRVLLVGKDGNIKRDSQTVVPLVELFAEIDRMPMRREEVRRRGQ